MLSQTQNKLIINIVINTIIYIRRRVIILITLRVPNNDLTFTASLIQRYVVADAHCQRVRLLTSVKYITVMISHPRWLFSPGHIDLSYDSRSTRRLPRIIEQYPYTLHTIFNVFMYTRLCCLNETYWMCTTPGALQTVTNLHKTWLI